MKKSISALVLVLIAGMSSLASATVVSSNAGLTTYTKLVNFSTASLAPGTAVTGQFSADGLTFSKLGGGGLLANSCGTGNWNGYVGLSGDFLHTYGPGCSVNGTVDAFSMRFSFDVSQASFGLYMYGANTIDAYNDGVLVQGFSSVNGGRNYYLTFSNVIFDELRFAEGSAGNYFVLDNVAYQRANVVPEPASLALFGLGLAGLAGLRRQRRK